MDEQIVFAVDSYDAGLSIGRVPRGDFSVASLVLRSYVSSNESLAVRRRYAYKAENPLWELERSLMKLSRQGILSRSLIVFGVTTDPFTPFEGRFDCSMKALMLFERYQPAKLVIQTRSPLIVLSLPLLKRLGDKVSITVPLESMKEAVVAKFLPEAPRLSERLAAMTTLRKLGIHVTAQAFPILPYGDWHEDAGTFAEFLSAHADTIVTAPLISACELHQKRVKKSLVLEALAKERQFRYMRPDTDQKLKMCLEKHYSEKYHSPYELNCASRQLGWSEILTG